MAEYIERKVLLCEMAKLYNEREVEAIMTGSRAYDVTWNDAVYLVTIAPTIEAEPTKHGRWIGINRNRYNDDEATCSICGATFASGYSNPSWWDYCPNCGSRMDEESDTDENWYSDEYRRIGEDERDEVKE